MSKERLLKLEKGKIIPMPFDYMFTQVLNYEECMSALEGIVAIITQIPLEEIHCNLTILNENLMKHNKKEKLNKVDLLLNYHDDKINIELNSTKYMLKRNYVYGFTVASGNLKLKDKSYNEVRKFYQINFNNFNYPQRDILEEIKLRNELGEVADDSVTFYQIAMVKALDSGYNYVSKREEEIGVICRMLLTDDVEVLKESAGKIMKKSDVDTLTRRVEDLSKDDEMVYLYTDLSNEEMLRNTAYEDGKSKGEEIGKKKGRLEGKLEGKIEDVKNALALDLDIETIAKITGLSKEEIEKLK